VDAYTPFNEIIYEVKDRWVPSIDVLPDGNIQFEGKTENEKPFFQWFVPFSEQNGKRDYNSLGKRILRLYHLAIYDFFVEFLKKFGNVNRFHICKNCEKYFISKTKRKAKFCSKECHNKWHNRKRIESGEAREYKRKKRMEGAKESYYG
jgi:hypothetical protein